MKRSLLPAFAMLALTAPARADYAFVLTDTICDDQTNSMDVEWYRQTHATDTMYLFYFDSTKFIQLGHEKKLAELDEVAITSHGEPGSIAGVTGADFAAKFAGEHAKAPKTVYFMSYSSATKPVAGASVVGAFAARYPSTSGAMTEVGTISGTTTDCALRRPDSGSASSFAQAVDREGVDTSTKGKEIVKLLKKAWKDQAYEPPKATSFKAYCASIKPTPTLYPAFVANVFKVFGKQYLDLINENSGGRLPLMCGKDVGKVCQ